MKLISLCLFSCIILAGIHAANSAESTVTKKYEQKISDILKLTAEEKHNVIMYPGIRLWEIFDVKITNISDVSVTISHRCDESLIHSGNLWLILQGKDPDLYQYIDIEHDVAKSVVIKPGESVSLLEKNGFGRSRYNMYQHYIHDHIFHVWKFEGIIHGFDSQQKSVPFTLWANTIQNASGIEWDHPLLLYKNAKNRRYSITGLPIENYTHPIEYYRPSAYTNDYSIQGEFANLEGSLYKSVSGAVYLKTKKADGSDMLVEIIGLNYWPFSMLHHTIFVNGVIISRKDYRQPISHIRPGDNPDTYLLHNPVFNFEKIRLSAPGYYNSDKNFGKSTIEHDLKMVITLPDILVPEDPATIKVSLINTSMKYDYRIVHPFKPHSHNSPDFTMECQLQQDDNSWFDIVPPHQKRRDILSPDQSSSELPFETVILHPGDSVSDSRCYTFYESSQYSIIAKYSHKNALTTGTPLQEIINKELGVPDFEITAKIPPFEVKKQLNLQLVFKRERKKHSLKRMSDLVGVRLVNQSQKPVTITFGSAGEVFYFETITPSHPYYVLIPAMSDGKNTIPMSGKTFRIKKGQSVSLLNKHTVFQHETYFFDTLYDPKDLIVRANTSLTLETFGSKRISESINLMSDWINLNPVKTGNQLTISGPYHSSIINNAIAWIRQFIINPVMRFIFWIKYKIGLVTCI